MDDHQEGKIHFGRNTLRHYMEPNIRAIISEAIAKDIVNFDDNELRHILMMMELFLKSGQYMFFSYEGISAVKDVMANHLGFRRFVLNLSESVPMLVTALDGESTNWDYKFIDAIMEVRNQYQSGSTNSLLLPQVVEALTMDSKVVHELLLGNRWLVTLYLAVFTGAWTEVSTDYLVEQ